MSNSRGLQELTAIPFSSPALHLKQIVPERLTASQRRVLDTFARGFVLRTAEEAEERIKRDVDGLFGTEGALDDPRVTFEHDPAITRRFGGYHLPRSSYFTLANDAGGDDGGTLKSELLIYLRPTTGTFILLWDTTLADDRAYLFAQTGRDIERSLVVGFPCASEESLRGLGLGDAVEMTAIGALIALPLHVTTAAVRNVIDLRDPHVAAWFTDRFTRVSFHLFKPPLDAFAELLPALLAQDLGGSTFTTKVGQELRSAGAEGLIYPSARTDCHVTVRDGAVEDWYGWNFVDFRSAPPPADALLIDSLMEWPRQIASPFPGLIYSDVSIAAAAGGPLEGSWRVDGLFLRNRGLKELMMAYALLDGLSGATEPIKTWLATVFKAGGPEALDTLIAVNDLLSDRSADARDRIRQLMLRAGHLRQFDAFFALGELQRITPPPR